MDSDVAAGLILALFTLACLWRLDHWFPGAVEDLLDSD